MVAAEQSDRANAANRQRMLGGQLRQGTVHPIASSIGTFTQRSRTARAEWTRCYRAIRRGDVPSTRQFNRSPRRRHLDGGDGATGLRVR